MSDTKSYRINTNINKDAVLNVQLSQDIDFLEVLSLKLYQKDFFQLKSSNYGLIVGRVQANDGFGVPNVKVSVFVKLSDEDKMNTEITNIYPYVDIQTKDKESRRYNLLPDSSNNDCYQIVGTFPNKRLVLDNDTHIDIFDKYWKYTTVTNHAGDYMIFGVPTGTQNVHIDLDLSDIGILSQKPRDMYYKGYNENLFENANQFKSSTSLGSLSQILSQDRSVTVYPFWGDKETSDTIAITRCDLDVEYKFEPTCVFLGSIITDDYNNNILHNCTPTKNAGANKSLTTQSGTIEMIRKTTDGLVEEYQIQGNELINGDGIWCYQIPMNLDYVKTDEYGNLVPTDNPKQGIATRASVRFRVSINETNNEGIGRHRAKYLIPNNLELSDITLDGVSLANKEDFQKCFEFGSATPDNQFRDLYWNKIYSVKNYIPRIQTNNNATTENYSGIRSVNIESNNNPHPFNRIRLTTPFAYMLLCTLMQVVFSITSAINAVIATLNSVLGLFGISIKCIKFTFYGVGPNGEDECYAPGCWKGKGNCSSSYRKLVDRMQQALARQYDLIHLDFYNDWINGTLYMPLWFWKKTKKRKYLFGLFTKKATNTFCNCKVDNGKARLFETCAIHRGNNLIPVQSDEKNPNKFKRAETFRHGIIFEKTLKNGANVYYYAPGYNGGVTDSYAVLYSTDIILLGSFNSCDFDALPNIATLLPSTTANIPFLTTVREQMGADDNIYENIVPGGVNDNIDENDYDDEDDTEIKKSVEVTGMDWTYQGKNETPRYKSGLFLDISCGGTETRTKSCFNAYRLCELGVSYDSGYWTQVPKEGSDGEFEEVYVDADGLILRHEIDDNETRAMFATMNHNGLSPKYRVRNEQTSYDTYLFHYLYPINFDGALKKTAIKYGIEIGDNQDKSYVNFRYGTNKTSPTLKDIHKYDDNFLLTNNSFYFYFGLHNGKTAIDKYRELYDATCVKNEKQAFNYTLTPKPSKITEPTGEIRFESTSIRTPYFIEIYDDKNQILMWEVQEGEDVDIINQTDSGITKVESTLNNVTFAKLFNGVYRVIITDAMGNEMNQLVELIETNITCSTLGEGLGLKYVDEETTSIDLYKEKIGNCGEVRLYNFQIGDDDITIKNIEEFEEENKFIITFNSKIEGDIQYQMSVNGGIELPFSPKVVENEDKLIIYVYKPDVYIVTLQRLFNGELVGGKVNKRVVIDNNTSFDLYVNDTPVRFIKKNYYYKPLELGQYDFSALPMVGNSSTFVCNNSNINEWGEYVKGLSYMESVQVPSFPQYEDEITPTIELLEEKKNQSELVKHNEEYNVNPSDLRNYLETFKEEWDGVLTLPKTNDEEILTLTFPNGVYSFNIQKEMTKHVQIPGFEDEEQIGAKSIDVSNTESFDKKTMSCKIVITVGDDGIWSGVSGSNSTRLSTNNQLQIKKVFGDKHDVIGNENCGWAQINPEEHNINGYDNEYIVNWTRPYKTWVETTYTVPDNSIGDIRPLGGSVINNTLSYRLLWLEDNTNNTYTALSIDYNDYKSYINTSIEKYEYSLQDYENAISELKDTVGENSCIIMEYLLNKMIDVARGSIVCDGNSGFRLRAKGGKTPSLICSEYPDYNTIENAMTGCNQVKHSASTTRISCDEMYPTLVNKENYGYFNENNTWVPLVNGYDNNGGYDFNASILNGNPNIGVYIAAFDNEGNMDDETYNTKSQPEDAEPFENRKETSHSTIEKGHVENYFKMHFVDKHIGYVIECVMPYSGDTAIQGSLKYKLMGGLQLPFKISDTAEYDYELLGKTPINVANKQTNQKYLYGYNSGLSGCTVYLTDNFNADLKPHWYNFAITQLNDDGEVLKYYDGNMNKSFTKKKNTSYITTKGFNNDKEDDNKFSIEDGWEVDENDNETNVIITGTTSSGSETVDAKSIQFDDNATNIRFYVSSCSADMEPTYYKDDKGNYVMSLEAQEGEIIDLSFNKNEKTIIKFVDSDANQITIKNDGSIDSATLQFEIQSNGNTYSTWPVAVSNISEDMDWYDVTHKVNKDSRLSVVRIEGKDYKDYKPNENNFVTYEGVLVDDTNQNGLIYEYKYSKGKYVLLARHTYNSDINTNLARKEIIQYYVALQPNEAMLNPKNYRVYYTTSGRGESTMVEMVCYGDDIQYFDKDKFTVGVTYEFTNEGGSVSTGTIDFTNNSENVTISSNDDGGITILIKCNFFNTDDKLISPYIKFKDSTYE